MEVERFDTSTGVQIKGHMIFREDKGTGYMYCYAPWHPCANRAGKVMEHVYVVYSHTGRKPEKDECVHHIDRNRKNNSFDNLRVMSQDEHRALHSFEDYGVVYTNKTCPNCGDVFLTRETSSREFCTSSCASWHSRNFDIPKEELSSLVWELPTTKIASMYGVSDVAVAKRCKKFGISKPPRGYWAKIYSCS